MTAELKTIACCTIDDIGLSLTGDDAPRAIEAINNYLATFAKPVDSGRQGGMMMSKYDCLKCGSPIAGAMGTFRWGLVHGEGACGECGWPARAYHRITLDGEELFDRPLDVILQYHPSCVGHDEESGQDG